MDDGYCEILSAKKGQQKLQEFFFLNRRVLIITMESHIRRYDGLMFV